MFSHFENRFVINNSFEVSLEEMNLRRVAFMIENEYKELSMPNCKTFSFKKIETMMSKWDYVFKNISEYNPF